MADAMHDMAELIGETTWCGELASISGSLDSLPFLAPPANSGALAEQEPAAATRQCTDVLCHRRAFYRHAFFAPSSSILLKIFCTVAIFKLRLPLVFLE